MILSETPETPETLANFSRQNRMLARLFCREKFSGRNFLIICKNDIIKNLSHRDQNQGVIMVASKEYAKSRPKKLKDGFSRFREGVMGFQGNGARNFARKKYKSRLWELTSTAYRKAHPLCERCQKNGIMKLATCVHHKIHLTAENCNDPEIMYCADNLEALCDECHYYEHNPKRELPKFDEKGGLIL